MIALYHISPVILESTTLYPRNPYMDWDGETDEAVGEPSPYPENLPVRISFSPTIEQCLMAVWPNYVNLIKGRGDWTLTFQVYRLDASTLPETAFIPESKVREEVWDSHYTGEVCDIESCEIEHLGCFSITKDNLAKERYGHPYYGTSKELKILEPVGWDLKDIDLSIF